MVRFLTQDVSPQPPSLDDIADALKSGKLYCSDEMHAALRAFCRLKDLELFNFGPLTLDTVRDAQHEAISFVEHGHFIMPYPVSMYRGSVQYDNALIGTTIFIIEGAPEALGTGIISGYRKGIATIRVIKAKDHLFAMHSVCMDKVQLKEEGLAIQIEIRKHELDYWRKHFPSDEEVQWQMVEGSLIMLGMTMILNTKGVLKERSAPPHKPNKARAAAGRPPLPYTTRVYTQVYNSAVAPGAPGTHASPRPHRRRAHIRHMPATESREAYVIPIDAMLINWDGRPLAARKEYTVK